VRELPRSGADAEITRTVPATGLEKLNRRASETVVSANTSVHLVKDMNTRPGQPRKHTLNYLCVHELPEHHQATTVIPPISK
jgi:hypothetical protein